MRSGKEQLIVVKIGGNIIDDDKRLASFLQEFSLITQKKILVHGGGKMATRIAESMGIPQQMIDGRRITDAETLKIITMVYAGYANKNIVAQLQANDCNAFGLSGADGNSIAAHKRTNNNIDYGFAGDIDIVNAALIQHLLDGKLTPVFCPVTHNGNGQLLNTNADTLAQEIANIFADHYDATLIYCFEKAGVLMDAADDTSVINEIDPEKHAELRSKQIISEGMIPKMDNAFAALAAGVKHIVIGHADDLAELIRFEKGTKITV